MLVCGRVNPPPVTDPEYSGVYFHQKDDLPAKAKGLTGTPLRVEHHDGSDVGQVLSAWTAQDGSMFALAEIDTGKAGGAVAANYVRKGVFQGFSLGYNARMYKCKQTAQFKISNKDIQELSLCKEGARPGCTISKYC